MKEKSINLNESFISIMAYALDCAILVNEFKLQVYYFIYS